MKHFIRVYEDAAGIITHVESSFDPLPKDSLIEVTDLTTNKCVSHGAIREVVIELVDQKLCSRALLEGRLKCVDGALVCDGYEVLASKKRSIQE